MADMNRDLAQALATEPNNLHAQRHEKLESALSRSSHIDPNIEGGKYDRMSTQKRDSGLQGIPEHRSSLDHRETEQDDEDEPDMQEAGSRMPQT